MEFHDLPLGPIFLKEFGLDDSKIFKCGHDVHKLERIETLKEVYPDLPFLLIGDSGQHDPERYHRTVLDDPDRFLAVYLRDVMPEKRDREVHALAAKVEEAGCRCFWSRIRSRPPATPPSRAGSARTTWKEIESDRGRDADEESLLERLLG